MAAWVFLALAIATEVLGTLQLRELANGFRLLPAAIVTVSYVSSFVLMVPALRTINVGVSYAIWSAVGTAAVAGLGVVLFDERLNALAVVGIVLIVVGVVLLTGPVDKEWGMRVATFVDLAGHSWEVAQALGG